MNWPYVPATVPTALHPAVRDVLSDQFCFYKMIQIQDKDTKKQQPFVPNDAQTRFLKLLETHDRVIVIKARQVGISTAVRAYHMWQAYTATDPQKYAVLSFHDRSARYLRNMDKKWLKGFPTLLQRPLAVDNSTDSEYADTGAGISAYTTGGRGGTRSFSFTSAHLSEFAFYVDADETLAQVDATVGKTGKIVVESTVNVPGDAYHRLVAGAPQNGWAVFSYWWWEYPGYTEPAGPDFTPSSDELALSARYNLTFDQLQWRRSRISTLGIDKFMREYPACMDDCFIARTGGFFDEKELQSIEVFDFEAHEADRGFQIEAPIQHDRYVMGVDIGGGVGLDYSTICVLSVSTRQPVYFCRSNRMSPGAWAHRAIQIASKYNEALILAESNNHGHAFLLELNNCKYRNMWLNPKTQKPWVTTVASKTEAYDTLREALGLIKVLDRTTYTELRSLTIPSGKICPEAPTGLNDDAAMAIALSYVALRDVPPSWRAGQTPHAHLRVQDFLTATRARRIRANSIF